jgi:hypothetical protein
MLCINQPSTIGMKIVAFVTADSQPSTLPTAMKPLKLFRPRIRLWRSEILAGVRWPPNRHHRHPQSMAKEWPAPLRVL